MEKKQFSTEEINQIKQLQEKYNALGLQAIQIKLSKKSAEKNLEVLQQQEALLDDQIVETNNEERLLAETLETKYGAGQLDLETGVFTTKTE